jgi:hypothetical protein
MGRVALTVALCVALLAPAGAHAAMRHASPQGTANPDCSALAPCDLQSAVDGAVANDEIVVAGGVHALTATLTPAVPLSIHGAIGQRPRIVAAPGLAALASSASLALADLTLESTNATHTASLTGSPSSAERIEVHANAVGATTALLPGDGFLLRNSVVAANGGPGPSPGTDAVRYDASTSGAVALYNVTAIATGPNSNALALFAEDTGPGARIDATNVIADAQVDISALASPGSSSAINLFNSNFSSGEGTVSGVGNQVVPPRFVNAAAGDFHQAASSPTVDSGLTDPLSGPLDLDGNARIANGLTDIGAFEHQPATTAPPPAPPADTSAAATVIGALRLSSRGVFTATLTCPATESRCAWSYALSSRRRVRTGGRRRVIRFGNGRRTGTGGKRTTIRIRLSKRNFRLIRRKRRLAVKLTVRMTDAAANTAITKRTATLRAPKRVARR